MKLPCIITSDLHLTSSPADEYRWGLFPWLAKEALAEQAKSLLILGDLTDAKDYHSSELVNRIVESFRMLRQSPTLERIYVLRGNHDYLREGHMFFEFLRAMSIQVITKPTEDDDGELCMFMPFSRNPREVFQSMDFSHYQYVFMHQTLTGAVSESGQKLEGDDLAPYLRAGKVYSGDIHVPQIIGGVEYVGSPYHVHFGDNFKPRCIVLDHKGVQFDLHFPSPRRVMLDVVDAKHFEDSTAGLEARDQVKVRVALPEREKHLWRTVKADIEGNAEFRGVNVVSIELKVQRSSTRVLAGDRPAALFDPVAATYNYIDTNGLGPELLDAALECMKDV